MLALKKKREAEAKAAAAAQASASAAPSSAPSSAGESTSSAANDNGATTAASTNKVSLLGIGGKKTSANEKNGGGKKRTPGEIRIQKGESSKAFCGAPSVGIARYSRRGMT